MGLVLAGPPGKGQGQEMADKVRAGRRAGGGQADGRDLHQGGSKWRDFDVT